MRSNRGTTLMSSKKPSWGVSREKAKNYFVAEIVNDEKIGINTPAPGHTTISNDWLHNSHRHSKKDKTGPIYGVRGRDKHLNLHLSKIALNPGPGSYGAKTTRSIDDQMYATSTSKNWFDNDKRGSEEAAK